MEKTPAGYPLDPTLRTLEGLIGDLAAEWRGTQSDKIVRQYQAVLKCLIALDWDGGLDADAELPDEFMPPEYFEYLKRRYAALESPRK